MAYIFRIYTERGIVALAVNLDNELISPVRALRVPERKLSSLGMIDRVNMLKNYLVNVPRSVNRVVVAEFNPESKRGRHLQGVFPTVESLKVFYESCLSSFEVLDTKFSPGFGEKKRNVFFVFGKKH